MFVPSEPGADARMKKKWWKKTCWQARSVTGINDPQNFMQLGRRASKAQYCAI
jgi:hypothetical protein